MAERPFAINPRVYEHNSSRARLKEVPISKALTLISRYRGFKLKGGSCRPSQSLAKNFSSLICFGRVLTDLITI